MRLKGCLSETHPSPLLQNDHSKPKLSLCCCFAMKRERWHPFLHVFFTCYGYTKNSLLLGGKIWIVQVVFFGYEWLEFPHFRPQRSKRYCENCPSLSVFTTSGNLRLSNLKCKAQKIKNMLKVLVRFFLYSLLWNKNFWQLFEFWKFHVQLGKNTQNYKHTGQKQASRPHLFFFTVFECAIYGWHFCQVWKKNWIVYHRVLKWWCYKK